MTSEDALPGNAAKLHDRAEEIARGKTTQTQEDIEVLSSEGLREKLHELRVHQIELEMQNEELRRSRSEINAARARYFDLYNLAPVGYFTISEKGLILEANMTAATLLGVARAALINQYFTLFIHKEDQDIYYLHRKKLFETREPQVCDLQMVKSDGTLFMANLTVTATQGADNAFAYRIVINDITDRKRTEEALRESERKYRELFESSPVGIFKTNSTGQTLFANPMMACIVCADRSPEALNNFKDLAKDFYVDPNRRKEFIDLLKDKGVVENFEYEAKGLNGKRLWLSMNARVSEKFSDGAFIIDGFITDIAERKCTDEELRESEKKYRLITENTADLISIMDMNLHFTYVSPAAMRITGFTAEEIMSQTLEQILTPESMRLALDVFEKEMLLEASGTADPDRSRILELEEYKKDGSTIWMEVSLSFLRDKALKPVEIVIVARDITERKRVEEEKSKLEIQLQQAQKFKAIGTLAGGIAHDFNNLLMGIQGRASLLSLDLETSHPYWEHIHAIEEYVRSATSLTKQLLGFARGGKYEAKPFDMNELAIGTSAMFGRT